MVRRAAREVRGVSTPEPLRKYAALVALTAAAVIAGLGLWHGRSSSAPVDAAPFVAPAAVPATMTAPAPSPASANPAGVLSPLLLTLDHARSLDAAVGQVQALWGPDALQRTPLRTHMDQVRRLNLPVVLEMFHPARRDTSYIALLHLDGDEATIATDGAPRRVPLAEIDRLWTRQAIFL